MFYSMCIVLKIDYKLGQIVNFLVSLIFQSDEGSVPLFSVPRSSIAENPYTSLLLCSYFPHDETTNGRSTLTWCQHLTIEVRIVTVICHGFIFSPPYSLFILVPKIRLQWLTAAELGLLKGRHPLLKDVDVTINPSKGLTLVREPSYPSFRSNKLLDLPNSDALDGYSLDPSLQIFEGGDTAARFGRDSGKDLRSTEKQQETFSTLQNGSAADAESGGEEAGSPVDGERGMLQAAELVMNMLDVTMPDTLTEEQKKKVLLICYLMTFGNLLKTVCFFLLEVN